MAKAVEITPPGCASCNGGARKLVGGDAIYAHRPDLYDLWFWLCTCGAYCGCHKTKLGDGKRPLGRTANKELRAARSHCHNVFDPLWKNAPNMACYNGSEKDKRAMAIIRRSARTRTYRYLAACMNLTKEECHIGMMDLNQCRTLWSICKKLTPEAIRDWHKKQEAKDV